MAKRTILHSGKTGAEARSRRERGYPPELTGIRNQSRARAWEMEEKSAAFRCQEQRANGGFGKKTSSHGRARVALCVVPGSASTHLLLATGPIW